MKLYNTLSAMQDEDEPVPITEEVGMSAMWMILI
jgi:hypothetical protein